MRAAVFSLAMLLSFCASAEGPAVVKKTYPRAESVSAFAEYKIPGLSLWLVQMPSVPDRNGDRFVAGIDRKGKVVSGAELFKLAAPGLAPADVVRRAFDMLLGRAGGAGLDPATDQRSSIYPEEEWALVKAPSAEGGVITFWLSVGEMHPEVTRAQLTVATGEIVLRGASQVLHPPEAAIPGIREKLHAQDVATVKDGLGRVSEWKELAPDVEELLAHGDSTVRSMAISVLTNLHQPRSIPALIAMLERGPEWGDRSLAAQALLWRYGTPEAVAAVRARLARATEFNEKYVLRDLLKDYDAGKRY